jgi:threonine synthase
VKREVERGELSGAGVGRYARLLEFAPAADVAAGGTPLVAGGDGIFLKDEGANPTGSVAARAVVCAGPLLKAGKYSGESELLASLAVFAATAKTKAEFYFARPVNAADWLQASLSGARVWLDEAVPADARDMRTTFASAMRDGWSTLAFEIAEQMEWAAAARVLIADSRSDEAAAMTVGFEKLRELGWIASEPKIDLVARGGVGEAEMRAALEQWAGRGVLLSPEGAIAAAAANARRGKGPVVVINPSRGEKHLDELRAMAGVRSSAALPTSLRVGGVISPQ